MTTEAGVITGEVELHTAAGAETGLLTRMIRYIGAEGMRSLHDVVGFDGEPVRVARGDIVDAGRAAHL